MKSLLLIALAMGSFSVLAQDLDATVKKLAPACNGKTVLGEKVATCEVKLETKEALTDSILCVGNLSKDIDCKVSLVGNILKTKCNTKDFGLHFDGSESVQADFYQPTFEVSGRPDSLGFFKKATLMRGNETVITAQSLRSSLVAFHLGLLEKTKNDLIAEVKVLTPSGMKELKNTKCYLID